MALERIDFESGLTAYVDHMPQVHTSAIDAFVGYGSVQERPGEEGVAHALEHAVHAQTARFPNRAALRIFAKGRGVSTNASTYYTRTLYTTTGIDPRISLEHLGQILTQPTLPDDLVESEMRAVVREAKTGTDNPGQLHCVASDYAMFGVPAGRRVIGYTDKLDFTGDTLRAAFGRNYSLANMAVVAVGAVTVGQVMDGITSFFEQTIPESRTDPIVPMAVSGAVRATGLVHPGSRSVKLVQTVPLSEHLRHEYAGDVATYEIALAALRESCFRKLRYDKGISYDGGIGMRDYNHPDAWALTAYVTIDAEALPTARQVFDEVFKDGSSAITDEEISASLAMRRFQMLRRIDDAELRADSYSHRLSRYATPEDLEQVATFVARLTVPDIRAKIDEVCEFATVNPRFEHLTGNAADIAEVDELIDLQQIA